MSEQLCMCDCAEHETEYHLFNCTAKLQFEKLQSEKTALREQVAYWTATASEWIKESKELRNKLEVLKKQKEQTP